VACVSRMLFGYMYWIYLYIIFILDVFIIFVPDLCWFVLCVPCCSWDTGVCEFHWLKFLGLYF
jgi:hypothetical protein